MANCDELPEERINQTKSDIIIVIITIIVIIIIVVRNHNLGIWEVEGLSTKAFGKIQFLNWTIFRPFWASFS